MASGAVLSVDTHFSDWFGYTPEDLLGTYVSGLVVELARLEQWVCCVCCAVPVRSCACAHAVLILWPHDSAPLSLSKRPASAAPRFLTHGPN